MSITPHSFAPLQVGSWADPHFKEAFADRVCSIVDRFAPGFSQSIPNWDNAAGTQQVTVGDKRNTMAVGRNAVDVPIEQKLLFRLVQFCLADQIFCVAGFEGDFFELNRRSGHERKSQAVSSATAGLAAL